MSQYLLIKQGDAFAKSITCHHDIKTTCFGTEGMVLYGERKVFYGTKTTCFAIVEATPFFLNIVLFCNHMAQIALKSDTFLAATTAVDILKSMYYT